MAYFRDYPLLYRLYDRTPLLAGVRAVAEAAFVSVVFKFAEAACKLLLADNVVAVSLER